MSAMTGMSSMRGSSTGKDMVPKGYQKGSLQQFTPEQMQLFQGLFGHLGSNSFLSKLAGGDQSQFEQMEAPALRQFGELQGNIASRFSGMGSGARRSSGFRNTMNQASSDFAQQLQANRMGLQRQALQDLMGFSSQLLGQRPNENFLVEKPQSFLSQLGISAAGGLGMAAGSWLTGGASGLGGLPGLIGSKNQSGGP